ncbi:substrate-binding domain-containing protein [Amorphus orientalis]|uniref:Phosphate transport system substrate-binding protein n=1 Tax=Amorphus orientalis TaxID=649198 RepID=A0AAE3VR38_9HYPH|nr:substrate-binding domain-containing protein [Amorphus orientalis]MDQ0316789.1 phosphate transport system substrate-binding protein [Amorphus orientalis]
MKANYVSAIALAAAVGFGASASAQERDTIQIAGSSTVLPFASIVAEEFGNTFPEFNTPVVGSGGSGGGLRQFCQGIDMNTIDIANASRPIKAGEIESCNANGVQQIVEVKIGYDGIVFASNADTGSFELTPAQIYQAIAAKVPQDGELVDNPYSKWSEIDSSLPDQEITLVIPGTNHGTREVFEEKVVLEGCETFDVIKSMDGDAAEEACLGFRQGGRVIEIAGDYTETLARLEAQPAAVGVFGLSFYDQNRDRLQVATVNGVTPSLETVASGEYPVSRPLFFYIKGEHVGNVPGLEEYAQFFLNEQVSGMGSPLEQAGLIPLSAEERENQLANVENKTVVKK